MQKNGFCKMNRARVYSEKSVHQAMIAIKSSGQICSKNRIGGKPSRPSKVASVVKS